MTPENINTLITTIGMAIIAIGFVWLMSKA